MPYTQRTKKYTNYSYLETNPASEDAVRLQMDGAVDEVFLIMESEAALKTEVGNLASLLTPTKTSLVVALNEVGTAKANKIQENWIAPALLNSWVNFGAPFESTGYFKDELGIVHLRGFVKSGTIDQNIFVLPLGYRPNANAYFGTVSNDLFGAVRVNSDGSVIPKVGSNVWFSLEGITFRAV